MASILDNIMMMSNASTLIDNLDDEKLWNLLMTLLRDPRFQEDNPSILSKLSKSQLNKNGKIMRNEMLNFMRDMDITNEKVVLESLRRGIIIIIINILIA
jgi:hypothetical protein